MWYPGHYLFTYQVACDILFIYHEYLLVTGKSKSLAVCSYLLMLNCPLALWQWMIFSHWRCHLFAADMHLPSSCSREVAHAWKYGDWVAIGTSLPMAEQSFFKVYSMGQNKVPHGSVSCVSCQLIATGCHVRILSFKHFNGYIRIYKGGWEAFGDPCKSGVGIQDWE